jgi:hypothetical protein
MPTRATGSLPSTPIAFGGATAGAVVGDLLSAAATNDAMANIAIVARNELDFMINLRAFI